MSATALLDPLGRFQAERVEYLLVGGHAVRRSPGCRKDEAFAQDTHE